MKKIKIIKKEMTKKMSAVYDIEVDKYHHYILENGIISHNSGLKYAASAIIGLTKSQAKDKAGNIVGVYLTCKAVKNRFSKQGSKIKIYLDYSKGLNPYYGLQDFGEPILKKESKGWSLNGEKISEKQLWSMEWPKELLDHIQEKIRKQFSYGSTGNAGLDEIEEVEDKEEAE